ncbi:SCO family protein [Pseudoduganella lutea]|uniref:SCO family protein n=1 Tax=Pseudoduganella lutea TaxID=321985 RepID=A0A4P6L5Z1_9BURK|nr:SCO family protein [Pseudoduganella lutea]QBE66358.1 SCO family protein [Pseudoduganella lutea]
MKTLILALLLCTGAAYAQQLKSGIFEPPRPAPEISLPASTGKPFRLTDLRGKVVVLEFGFSHCQTVCPVSLAALAEAKKLVGPAARDVKVLFISVDPERDTPESLRTYLAQFDPTFIGITGTRDQIAQLLKDYGITARKHPIDGGGDYSMSHSSYLYFIDRQGRQRAMMPFGRPAREIAHDLAILLKP